MSLIDDLTDQKQLEREVIKYTKISSIADIAYTLAHEINNPLTGIKLGLSTLYKSLQKEENIQVLDSVMKDLNRIQKTVRAFLIAKKDQFRLKKEKISVIEQIITDVIFHLSAQLDLQDVSVQKAFSTADYSILIDRDRMYQVFLNVFLNAVQAISENGNIEISTEVTALDNSIASGRRFLKISLSDDGSGIDPEQKQDVFRPFYSSKPGGTGLGLSICKDIVAAHKGTIQIESEKDTGTTVNIYIPVISE
jgi:signal transduction histidine kinase